MKNNKKKGFTLVELLVVIAILAILASVSVVGYLSFTEKAKISNVEGEMTQARTVIQAEFLEENSRKVTFNQENYIITLAIDKISVNKAGTTEESLGEEVTNDETVNSIIEALSSDLADLPGTFSIDNGNLVYTNDEYAATWNIEENTVVGSKVE